MKNFNEVYRNSKVEVLAKKQELIESQKVSIITALKEMYMITGKITDLPKDMQIEMKKRVLEYWDPKTGITKAGTKLLNEREITLSENSKRPDIKMYIGMQVQKHYTAIAEAYRNSNVDVVIDAFKEDLYAKTKKHINEKFIKNTIWKLIEENFKNGTIFK